MYVCYIMFNCFKAKTANAKPMLPTYYNGKVITPNENGEISFINDDFINDDFINDDFINDKENTSNTRFRFINEDILNEATKQLNEATKQLKEKDTYINNIVTRCLQSKEICIMLLGVTEEEIKEINFNANTKYEILNVHKLRELVKKYLCNVENEF